MSAKAISEYTGKELLYRHLDALSYVDKPRAIPLSETDNFEDATANCDWLRTNKGVIKPDQLIKRRGKHGLVKIGTQPELAKWFNENKGQYKQVGKTTGRLSSFIVEPFVAHTDKDELYVAIYSLRDHDVIMFYEEGGVEIGDVDAKVKDR